jgi:hypothetical protein
MKSEVTKMENKFNGWYKFVAETATYDWFCNAAEVRTFAKRLAHELRQTVAVYDPNDTLTFIAACSHPKRLPIPDRVFILDTDAGPIELVSDADDYYDQTEDAKNAASALANKKGLSVAIYAPDGSYLCTCKPDKQDSEQ